MDRFNTLAFYYGNTVVDVITGSDVLGSPGGDQGVNGTIYVNINTLSDFDNVRFTSTEYAFEFDNVAYDQQPQHLVPDGGSLLGVFGLALAGLASVARRRGSD